MALRSDDQDFRWPRPGGPPRHEQRHELSLDAADELSLRATLRELAVTIAGFAAAIVLTMAAVSALYA
jgi:hypothetical protein